MNHNSPIFIVGVPRSGTTLLAAMLAAHSRLSCGTETRFFHFLAKADVSKLCCPSTWPEHAVDFLVSMQLVDTPIPKHFGLTRAELYRYLKARPPAVPLLLAALTEQLMTRESKERWVEKSPEHLRYVHEIRDCFPEAPIIRIVRDPRDVALSLMKAPWAPEHFSDNLLLWRRYDEQSAEFFETDPSCYTIYYEQLVQSPAVELSRLCTFIGETYEPQMLDTSQSAANVVTEKDRWHRIVHKPADRSRSQVWRRELSPEEQRLAEALIGDRLLAYGYPYTARFAQSATVFPSIHALLKHPVALHALVASDTCFWPMAHKKHKQLLVYVGEPDRERWLRREKWARLAGTLQIMGNVLKRKLAHQRVYWVRSRQDRPTRSYLGRALTLLFRFTTERQSAWY